MIITLLTQNIRNGVHNLEHLFLFFSVSSSQFVGGERRSLKSNIIIHDSMQSTEISSLCEVYCVIPFVEKRSFYLHIELPIKPMNPMPCYCVVASN